MKTNKSYSFFGILGILILFATLSFGNRAYAGIVNLPYTNSYDGDTLGFSDEDPDFFVYATFGFGNNFWKIVTPGIGGAGNGFVSFTTNSTGTIYSGATLQTFIPAPLPLSLSVQMQILETNSVGSSFMGLAAYGNRMDVGIVGAGTSSGTVIWPEMQITGSSGVGSLGWVNFLNAAGANTGINIGTQVGGNLPINTNDVYLFTLNGTYDASTNLTLTLTVVDTNTSASASRTEVITNTYFATNYASGSYFGLMDRYNSGNTGLLEVTHDNFKLSADVTTNYTVDPSQSINSGGWTLTYNDEFGGSVLNTNKWGQTFQYGGAAQRTLNGNNELEVYLNNQTVETNGILRLVATPTNYVWFSKTYNYASGMINTYQKHGQQYGYFEIRAKTPPGIPTGDGLWPAFWMEDNTTLWPPEMDILEILDSLQMEPHMGAIQNPDGAYFAQFYPTFDASQAFHVYSLEWSPSGLVYYYDNMVVGTCADPVVSGNPTAPVNVVANLAVGGSGTIPPDTNTVFPAYYDIDYIRIWTRTNDSAPVPYSVGYDIGAVGLAGSTEVSTNGTAIITGAGLGYQNGSTLDSFQYAAEPEPGDVDYDFLIDASSMSASSGQAGVMARQSLDPGSPYTAIYISSGNCIFQSRTTEGGTALQTATASSVSVPQWLRLLRRGNVFAGYLSTNGFAWACVGVITNDISQTNTGTLGTSVYIGAAVSSGATNTLNTVGLESFNDPAVTIIQDNTDPTGVQLTGPWVSSSGIAGFIGANFLSDNKTNKGECFITYTPTIPVTADYDLYINWPESSHGVTNEPVTVTDASGETNFTFNVQSAGGRWTYEGTYPFNAGTNGNVLISNTGTANGLGVLVDAIALVPGVSGLVPSIPVPPTGLSTVGSNAAVILNWTQSASPGITRNNVYRSTTGSGGPFNLAASIPATTSYVDTNVVNGSTYFYSVTAVDTFGESAKSAYAGATPIAPVTPLADAYVRNGTFATDNFGTSTNLSVKTNAVSFIYETYIKFGVTNLASAKSVTLQLIPTFVDVGASNNLFQFELVTNNNWTTTGITWNTKPAGTGIIMGTATGFQTNITVHVNVTSQTKAQANSGGQLTIHIFSSTYTNGVSFAADRGQASSFWWPQLIVTQ